MSALCPCCKQPFTAAPGLHIDLNTNTLFAGEKSVRLSPREAEYIDVLLSANGQPVSRERMLARIFGASSEGSDRPNLISVYICRLRPIVEELGFRIDMIHDLGYRLVEAKSEQVVRGGHTSAKQRLSRASESVSNSSTQIHA